MSVLSGYQKINRYIKQSGGYKKLSQWTSSQTVQMDDGHTLQTNLGNIKGITSSLATTNANYALSATAGKSLQDQITTLNNGLDQWETIAHTTWIPTRNYTTMYEFSGSINKTLGLVSVYLRIPFSVYGTAGYTSVVGAVASAYRPRESCVLRAFVYNQNYILNAFLSAESGELHLGALVSAATGSQHVVISGVYKI